MDTLEYSDADREELAQERTRWAEDRTLLASERTFGSWVRTGLGSLGVALGFHALFRNVEPTWLAQLGASAFVAIAIIIFWAAFASARKVLSRLDSHDSSPPSRRRLAFIAASATVGATVLLTALWRF